MVLLLLPSLLAAPRISELLYDPSGADHDQEWVEVCNPGPGTINLSGYVLQMGGTSWKSIFTVGTVSDMAPGDYVLIGGPLAGVGYTGSFVDDIQNGGSDVDGVRLMDGSSVVLDTVLFGGSANGNLLLDDSGSSDPLRAASSASNGKSLGRDSACTDTDNSSVDFRVYTSPTPAMANVAIGDSGGDSGVVVTVDCTGWDGVVINEFLPDATGADDGQEWVELYNRGSSPVDLSGWVLALAGSTWDNGDEMTLDAGLGLNPGGYLLLGTTSGDAPLSMTLPNASSSGEGLQLRCNGAPVDTVVYGPSNGDSLTDDSGAIASSLAPKPKEAQSIGRKVDGEDSNQSGDDFQLCASPSPGAPTSCVYVPCTVAPGEVLINELSQNTGTEFVELYNASSVQQDLTGFRLEYGTGSYSGSTAIPAGSVLEPGGYLVIEGMDPGNAGSNADAIRLVCDDGVVYPIDTVVYAADGKTNTDGWLDDDGQEATSFAPVADDGESVARSPNGVDTNQSGVDFLLVTAPTPGAENGVVDPGECDTGAGIKVNEVMFDPSEDDDTNEWVELFNAGSSPVDLKGWKLEAAKSSWAVQYSFEEATVLAPGEWLVIGAEDVAEADVLAEDLDLGNGTDGDGVRITDCAGVARDTALYGDPLADEISGDNGSTDVVQNVGSGQTLGRYPDGLDNDENADWLVEFVPTPGAANTAPVVREECPKSLGCGEEAPSYCPPTRGCSTSMPLGGWEWVLGTLALLRRRR